MANRASERAAAAAAPASRPAGAVFVLLCAVALAGAAWALHLWRELATARAGGAVTCPFDSQGGCANVWDSAFAQRVEALTHLPIAAHGLVWSLAALALPLAALALRGAGRRADTVWAGVLVTGAAGVAAVIVLAAAQLVGGEFCTSCAIAYALVFSYAALCLFSTARPPLGALVRGGAIAAVVAGVFFFGLSARSPQPAASSLASTPAPHAPPSTPAQPSQPPRPADLKSYLAQLPPSVAGNVAIALQQYAAAPPREVHPPRALLGSSMAPVLITDFADLLCSHCAQLHAMLEEIRHAAPEGSFAIDSRYFPLDGKCNPSIPQAGNGVRCTAARVLLCLENEPGAFELQGELYRHQGGLTDEGIYALAEKLRPRDELKACVASPATDEKLRADIAWANEYKIQGTPLVLVNGRQAMNYGPFLFALILAGGDPGHADFAALAQMKGG